MNEREHMELFISGAPLDVVSLTGEEAVSRLFRFDLVCRAGEGLASAPGLVAAEARVVLWDGHGAERAICGQVTAAAGRISDNGTVELAVTVRPHAYVLALGRACRVYQNKTVVDIVKEVIARSAQKTKWELVSSYKPHEYCAEYREDDLTFMTRMLEEEGIHFRFDHDGGATTLVFDDSSTIGPDLPGGADIEFSYQRGMRAGRELIEEIGGTSRATPNRFSIHSFNPQNPKLAVKGAAGHGAFEWYDAPGGGPDSPDACGRRATILDEAAGAAGKGVTGTSTSVRLVPGTVMHVGGSPPGGDGG